jgi:hypothetical protein
MFEPEHVDAALARGTGTPHHRRPQTWLASIRYIISHRTRATRTLLATSGDRLALYRELWTGPGDQSFEIETLSLTEVDAEGRIVARIIFDPDDRRAANLELVERLARSAGRGVSPLLEWRRGLIAGDLERIRAVLPDDFVYHDHRRSGAGRLETADAYLAWTRSLFEQSPDAISEPMYEVASGNHGILAVSHAFGTLPEGGSFESVFVNLIRLERGRPVAAEIFELEDLDVARARFEALRPDPLRIPPNGATRACDRVTSAGEAQDWDALRALCAPALEFDDRRRGLRTSGDVETFLASWRYGFSHGARAARTLLATSGDRLALYRHFWTGAEDRPAFEIETLTVTEVDAEGRIVARITFDPDDRRAAAREMFERTARSDVARRVPAAVWEFVRALLDRDPARVRAALPDDYVFYDHRRTGVGRLERADDYVPWHTALWEQSSDAIYEPMYTVARGRHGLLSVMRLFGTLAEGGPFESVYVNLLRFQGDRFVGAELFELEDLDVARARFEELRPDATRIVPHAACRVRDRMFRSREGAPRPREPRLHLRRPPQALDGDRRPRGLHHEHGVHPLPAAAPPHARAPRHGRRSHRARAPRPDGRARRGRVRDRPHRARGSRRGRPTRGGRQLGPRRSPRRVRRGARALRRRRGGRGSGARHHAGLDRARSRRATGMRCARASPTTSCLVTTASSAWERSAATSSSRRSGRTSISPPTCARRSPACSAGTAMESWRSCTSTERSRTAARSRTSSSA